MTQFQDVRKVNFDEPFGLSVVEALACGTPVIACNRGSMPELIDDGVTGFLVNNVDEAVNAISRIGEIDRAACRAAVSARFTVDRMADRYLDLYRSLLGRGAARLSLAQASDARCGAAFAQRA
jgi:glycosyltransferase involved in cell wall biosynthesis